MNVQLSEKKYHLSLNEMYMIPYILIMNKIIIKTHFIDLHVFFDSEQRHCISTDLFIYNLNMYVLLKWPV